MWFIITYHNNNDENGPFFLTSFIGVEATSAIIVVRIGSMDIYAIQLDPDNFSEVTMELFAYKLWIL